MSENTKGILSMLICSTLWSLGGLFIKLLPWNAVAIAGMRSLTAGCVVLIYMKAMGYRLEISRRTLTIAVSLAGTYLSFVAATKLTTAANAIVIQYTGPLYLLLYNAIFRHQKLHLADCGVVLMTVLGIGLFFLDDLGGGTAIGNCVAMLCGLFFAAMFITTGDIPQQTRMSGILLGQALTAAIGLPVFFATRAPVTWGYAGCILVLGVFQLGLSYVFYARAMSTCPPLACSLLATMEPLLNPVWVLLFAGEKPGLLSLCGGLVVIVSITVWCVWNTRRASAQSPAPADGPG